MNTIDIQLASGSELDAAGGRMKRRPTEPDNEYRQRLMSATHARKIWNNEHHVVDMSGIVTEKQYIEHINMLQGEVQELTRQRDLLRDRCTSLRNQLTVWRRVRAIIKVLEEEVDE